MPAEKARWSRAFVTATVAGQNLGASQSERADKAVDIAARFGLSGAALVGFFFLFFPRPLLNVFGMDEPAVVESVNKYLGARVSDPVRVFAAIPEGVRLNRDGLTSQLMESVKRSRRLLIWLFPYSCAGMRQP